MRDDEQWRDIGIELVERFEDVAERLEAALAELIVRQETEPPEEIADIRGNR